MIWAVETWTVCAGYNHRNAYAFLATEAPQVRSSANNEEKGNVILAYALYMPSNVNNQSPEHWSPALGSRRQETRRQDHIRYDDRRSPACSNLGR